MKKKIAFLLAVLMLSSLLAGSAAAEKESPAAPEENGEEAAEEENYGTGDASLDNPRNQDGIGERELLVVSFGTSFNDSRRLTVGGIESAIEKAFPDWSVRRGFTSQIIIDHVKARDGEIIDNVGEALDRAAANGVKTLLVQPTHLMNGFEYNDLIAELAAYADAFEKIAVGEPLLTSEEDFARVAEIIVEATKEYDDGETAICFMGHGTEAESNAVYAKMQQVLTDMGCENRFIGTVEAEPSLDDVVAAVKQGNYRKVVLEPLMIVAGDHANNDMAGDEEDSWKSVFEAEGYEVTCLLRGLGEMEAIQELFVEHARAAMLEQETSKVADASQMTTAEEVVEEGMKPVPADELRDGSYAVEVSSSSSMFRIEDCVLTAADGKMTAKLTMSSASYGYLYPGTAAQAAAAADTDCIASEENAEGKSTFVFPVEALDKGLSCAAWSRNKELWYDRILVFRADSLPPEAFRNLTTAESLSLPDGSYAVSVTLGGGSGKASVQSPCRLWIEDGAAEAEVVWSSPNYDYMIVNGEQISTEVTDGHAACIIPVAAFDRPLPVIADTTAMSRPHEISYTLCFDAATIVPAS
ncbi:MAG: sirohydrochlorin cobaltochelatase [Oscillospiraceae bacterium]|nr:sirohydrochlorin cobaltochelatase [Oscillospiraceae bacterium]